MKIQKRHALPGKFHWEPYETQWHFEKTSGSVVVYLQVSTNEKRPKWVRFGSLLEIALREKISDEEFMRDCFAKYIDRLDCEPDLSDD